jgi:hypothetical protein
MTKELSKLEGASCEGLINSNKHCSLFDLWGREEEIKLARALIAANLSSLV